MSVPELEEFRRRLQALRRHVLLAPHINREHVALAGLADADVATLLREDIAYYFLIAAADLNRTSLKRAMKEPAAQIVTARLRRAYAVKSRLPVRVRFADVAAKAVALRAADISRKGKGAVEGLFRERLKQEDIPLSMSPPVVTVPGLLVGKRKPDGVYPDPSTGLAPLVYLEIKNVRRVSDDIQKRLYEIAEASLEMKYLYGSLKLDGISLASTADVLGNDDLRTRLRSLIVATRPTIVALFLCPKVEAERYRAGAEAFIDRLFFEEEIEDCLAFLKLSTAS